MTKHFCDVCGVDLNQKHGCQWWTLEGYEDLCRECYSQLKQKAAEQSKAVAK